MARGGFSYSGVFKKAVAGHGAVFGTHVAMPGVSGGGTGGALADASTAQLRQVAQGLGIEVANGASRDDLLSSINDKLRS